MSEYEESPEFLKARVKNEEQRREILTAHYGNEQLYVMKLRAALESIVQAAELDENPEEKIASIAKEALAREHMPPGPLDHFYDDGHHTGHPFPEYLDLPMRTSDEYVDPHNGPVVLFRNFWKMASAIRAYCRETGLQVVVTDNKDLRRIGFTTGCPASDPRYRVFAMAIVDVQLTANKRPKAFEGLTDQEMMLITHPWLMSGDSRHKVAEYLSTGVLPSKEVA